MEECCYCQDLIEASKAFKLTTPDSQVVLICTECMGAITKHFKSGDAENELLDDQDKPKQGSTGNLAIERGRLVSYVKDKNDNMHILQTFDNVEIRNMSMKRGYRRGMYDYQDPRFLSNLDVENIIEFQGILLDKSANDVPF